MWMFQALYNGESKSLNLIALAIILLFSHVGMWLFIENTKARIEYSTKVRFQRGLLLLLAVVVTVLSLSFVYPYFSSSIGFQITVSALVTLVVIHTLTRLSQSGMEVTAGYIAAAGAFFVVLVILPALFVSNVPQVVTFGVLGVSILVISTSVVAALLTLKRISVRTSDALAAFRARRIIKVLLCSTTLAAFLLVCTPFMLYATPIESIATVFCSSLVCVSGIHVATERVGFLVEYARAQVPHLNEMQPHELEYVAQRTINSARALIPTILHADQQIGMVPAPSRTVIPMHENRERHERALIESIIAHQEVEKEIFRALMRVAGPGSEYITFHDFSELLLPHIQFGRKMVGENIVGISEESMGTVSQVISAAKSDIPVLFCGERGVGKHYFASLLGKIRGIAAENIHTLSYADGDLLSCLTSWTNKFDKDTQRRMIILRLNPALSSDSIAHLVRAIILRAKALDVAILINRRAAELPHISLPSEDSILVPEVIDISPLRHQPQDLVCQAIWFLFNEAHTMLGEVGVKRLRVKNTALLESLAYFWPANSLELLNATKAALYFAHRSSSFEIESIVPFLRSGDNYVAAQWLRAGLDRYFLEFSSDDAIENQLVTQIGVNRDFAKRVIQSIRQPQVMTA